MFYYMTQTTWGYPAWTWLECVYKIQGDIVTPTMDVVTEQRVVE